VKEICFNGPGHRLVAGDHVIERGVLTTVSNDLADQLAADPHLDVTVSSAKTKDGPPAGRADDPEEEE
jgi:hypothetical protein